MTAMSDQQIADQTIEGATAVETLKTTPATDDRLAPGHHPPPSQAIADDPALARLASYRLAGYDARLALSHHVGGWLPCDGPGRCKECNDVLRLRATRALHRQEAETGRDTKPAKALGDDLGAGR